MMAPINILEKWLEEEQQLGAPSARSAVLATTGLQSEPHNRVVAIREMNEEGILFFTQKGTRKVQDLMHTPLASIVFWLALKQREVVIEGDVVALTAAENKIYWDSYPREAQLRFSAYAETSAQVIDTMQTLEDKKTALTKQYEGQPIPLDPFYCGFRIVPKQFMFYAVRLDTLSEVFAYRLESGHFKKVLLSP